MMGLIFNIKINFKEQFLFLLLGLLIFSSNTLLAQKIVVGEGNSLSDFELLDSNKLKLVCYTGAETGSTLGILKSKELVAGAVVKLVNAAKLKKRFKAKMKRFKSISQKRSLGAKQKRKDIQKASKQCTNSGSDDSDDNDNSDDAPEVVKPSERSLGTNLYWVSSSSSQILFTNAMKRSSRWFPNVHPYDGSFDSGVDVPLDDQGYPLQVPFSAEGKQHNVMTFVFNDMGGNYPAGDYTFSFSGTGSVTVSGDTQEQEFSSAGTYVLSVSPTSQGIIIEINQSAASDPIRNMKLILPGFANSYKTTKFHPTLINALKGFTTLRMSNPQQVNSAVYPCTNSVSPSSPSCLREWKDRAKVNYRTYSGPTGIPLEVLIDLVNEVDASPWFHIHHGSTDDFIQNFAELVYDRLDSQLNVYLEYSNEVWNSDEPYQSQRTYSTQKGLELGFDQDSDRAREKYITHMTCKMGNLFDQAFGKQKTRVKTVMPAFNAFASVTDRQLAAQDDQNVCASGRKADLLAMAAYFGIELPAQILAAGEQGSITVTSILQRARDNISKDIPDPISPGETSDAVMTSVNAQCAIANKYNIQLVAYEGGQHLQEMNGTSNNQVLGQKLLAANAHKDMGTAFTELFDAWFASCGGLFNIYTFMQRDSLYFGMFGTVTDMYDTSGNLKTTSEMESEYPKFKAVRDEMRKNQQIK